MFLKLASVLAVICAISAQILPPSGFRRVRPGPIIHTRVGAFQGQEETYDFFRRIYTFKGIRYGIPPVGDLRFKQGVEPLPFQTLYQAWQYGPRCPQLTLLLNRFEGEEDCLFLNIATPTNIRSALPVVVALHGGGLQFGHGEADTLGPELMNQENVIFVSFNYRLGVLGFLNTGDASSPGNFGMKDMIMALRWVQTNIEYFGGNPNDVTILGISGGAVAVQGLVVSPVAAGLFHKAISQSGSMFNNWAFNRNPLRAVEKLKNDLQLFSENSTDLVNQLRQVSLERLIRTSSIAEQNPRLFEEIGFLPSIDPVNSLEPRIFTAPISFLVRFGEINRVPYMIGFNGQESLYAFRDLVSDPSMLEPFNQNPNLLVPTEWGIAPNSPNALEVIQAFRNLYFDGQQNITVDNAWQWTNYVSDREFIFGISKQARLHSRRAPVYYFRFSYSGSLSFAQRALGLSTLPGAMHGDDAFYLFRLNLINPVLPSDEAYLIQRRYVRMWTNFIKYANPTPTLLDPLIDAQWPLLTDIDQFMDIGRDLMPNSYPFPERMDVWHAFDQRFNPF